MRAAQLVEYRKPLEITEIPDPACGPTDVVIKVSACGICRTDWHLWNGDWDWIAFQAPLPHVPGHEIAGTIVEIGSEIRSLSVGDSVTVPWHQACGDCASCRRAHTNTCERVGMAGFGGYTGGYAEYVAVPNADLNVVAIPSSIDPLDAFGLGCRYMAAFGAVVCQGAVQAGESLLIVGAGGLGLSAVQIGVASGATVVAVDIDPAKLDRARAEGAVGVVDARDADALAQIAELTSGGAHVSVDTLCRPESIQTACLGTRRQGRVVEAAYTTQPQRGILGIPMDALSLWELQLIGSGAGLNHQELDRVISLVERGVLKPSTLVTEQIGLDAVTSVYEAMDDFRNIGLSVITTI